MCNWTLVLTLMIKMATQKYELNLRITMCLKKKRKKKKVYGHTKQVKNAASCPKRLKSPLK